MHVVAAVIERQGRILICQRHAAARQALKWEFPGGKVEPGEDAPTALARELREELNVRAHIGPLLHAQTDPFLLQFFQVTEFSGEPVNLQFEQILWEHPHNLPAYDFLEGDLEFVRKLATGSNPLSPSCL
jgi:8-oxo-dGTP diphosphatase